MKSYFVELTDIGRSHLNQEEIDVSDLKENEALIEAEYSMISAGTELSRAFGLKKGFRYPVRPGYCMVGKLLAKGSGIDIEPGERVYVNAPHASLVRWKHTGKVQDAMILKLPRDLDPKEATVINLLLVAIQGVNLCDVKLGYRLAVLGLGNIGIFTALMFKKLGCEVTGVDPIGKRRELATNMGISKVSENLKDEEEFDIVVDATGLSEVINNSVKHLKAYGQLLLLGSPRQSYECDMTPFLSAIHMKNIIVRGAFNNTAPFAPVEGSDNSLLRNYRVVCDLLRNKDIDVSKMIDRVIDPKDCEEAYYDLMYNKDKATCILYDWHNYQNR
jgi:2-desacetyl-2-hydroxyethyl bacteriochlorophyllide A dehydrogenase